MVTAATSYQSRRMQFLSGLLSFFICSVMCSEFFRSKKLVSVLLVHLAATNVHLVIQFRNTAIISLFKPFKRSLIDLNNLQTQIVTKLRELLSWELSQLYSVISFFTIANRTGFPKESALGPVLFTSKFSYTMICELCK